jgi:hypothetical protein
VGFGEVSAEEVERDGPRERTKTPPEERAEANGHGGDLLISEKQGKRLWAIAKDCGWTDADLKVWLRDVYQLESIRDIPRTQYNEIVDAVKAPPEPGDDDGDE